MSRARIFLSLLTAVGLLAPMVTKASLVWRPGEGWSDESGGDISASSSRDQLEAAHKLEAQGQRDDALKAYKSLLRRWPLSFFAPEAQYRMGKILEDEGDFYSAFQSFQKMVTKYPSSNYFEQALGEQYRIANLYLAGEPQRVWKIPVGPSMDRTVEMYERIIKNAPYGTYAPECQFKIGLARESQRRFTDAVDSYQKVLDNYPTSSVAADAQYQIGYAWMHASQTGDYDMGAAKKAIDAFQDYLVRYPTSDKADQAQENIMHLGKKQTQGAYDIAQFYERSHPPDRRAAYIYYNEVVREDPNSAEAQKAKKRIQELRPLVEAMPGGAGPDGAPLAAQTIVSGPVGPNGGPGPAPDAGPSSPAETNAPANTADPAEGTPMPAASGSNPSENPLDTPGASTPGGTPTPAPTPASSSSTNAPASAPPDTTPLPQ
jgi:outer membrane protein assembly factor BamD